MILRNRRNFFFLVFLIAPFILIIYFNDLIQKERFKMEGEIDIISKKLELALDLNQKKILDSEGENESNNFVENKKEIVVLNNSDKEIFSEEKDGILKKDIKVPGDLKKNEELITTLRNNDLKKIEQQLESFSDTISLVPIENRESVSPDIFHQLKESGINRYFLTGTKLIDNSYIPMIHVCLHRENYPSYVYHTWSSVNYPEYRPEITLVRYVLLPKDNINFKPDSLCYLREIITEDDWEKVGDLYVFYKELFN